MLRRSIGQRAEFGLALAEPVDISLRTSPGAAWPTGHAVPGTGAPGCASVGTVKVLVCIVNWNTAGHLPGCLEALVSQRGVDHEVVVVDNASVDDSADVVRRHGVRLVANTTNRGYAGAANQGVSLAREMGAEALVLANPDAVATPDHLARTTAVLAAHPTCAAVQGRLWRGLPGAGSPEQRRLDTTGHQAFVTRLFRNRGEGEYDRGQYAAGEVFGVSGALATYRLAALDDVAVEGEVFDEELFAFFEDVDLDWRLRMRGWSARYEPMATAWHERGGAGVRRSALVERLNFTNRALVVLKNDDGRALLRAAPQVGLTTTLKALELGLTVPSALARSVSSARSVPSVLHKRRVVQQRALTSSRTVVQDWFAPFDYGHWVTTWWRRVTRR